MDPQSSVTLGNTLGVSFLSVVGASILSGSTFAQTYIYYHNYPQDSILNKCAVGILCLLDTLHLTFFVHAIYGYNVTQYGNPQALQSISLTLKLQALLGVIIVLFVQSLYAHRVWMLSGYHRGILGYFVVFVVVAGAAVGIVIVYVVLRSQTLTVLEQSAWAISAAFGTSTCIDFVITAAMCYYLCKSRGNICTTLNSKISKIIQYTISSGLLTSSFSLAALFSYILMPQTYIGVSLTGFGTKLYIASFLAMLNSREQTNQRIPGVLNAMTSTSGRRPSKTGINAESRFHLGPTQPMCAEEATVPPLTILQNQL